MLTLNIALLVVIALLTGLSFYKGKTVLFSLIVSFYPAAALYASFPYKKNFIFMDDNAAQVFYSHAIIFAAFFALSFFVARRIVHSDGNRSGVVGFVDALALSVSVVLLSTALTYHVLPYRDVYGLSKALQTFLSGNLGYFVSMSVPVAVIFWMTGRRY
ncbi:MAG TPA: hypothetical protein VGE62_03070 [Candidatus Paceibacterota bacterium]